MYCKNKRILYNWSSKSLNKVPKGLTWSTTIAISNLPILMLLIQIVLKIYRFAKHEFSLSQFGI